MAETQTKKNDEIISIAITSAILVMIIMVWVIVSIWCWTLLPGKHDPDFQLSSECKALLVISLFLEFAYFVVFTIAMGHVDAFTWIFVGIYIIKAGAVAWIVLNICETRAAMRLCIFLTASSPIVAILIFVFKLGILVKHAHSRYCRTRIFSPSSVPQTPPLKNVWKSQF